MIPMDSTHINGTSLHVPPHNPDAELGLLGSLLYLNEAIEQVDFSPEYFYGVENQIVAETIFTLWKNGCRALDHITLGNELQRTGRLESAGGVPYLFTLAESVPHAEHVRYYADIVREKYQRRKIIRQCELLSSEARRPDTNIGHLVEHLTSILKDSCLGTGGKKLLTKSAWNAVENPVPKRPVVIDGLMRRGDVANIIASTKVGKSWFAVLLAFCVATGRDWLGRGVAQGNVLLIDNELYDADIQNRLSPVAHAMSVLHDPNHSRFDYVALRGNLLSITDLETLLMQYEPGDLTLIVMDAKYRFFGDLEENSNEDQTIFHNIIDRVAKHLECVIVLIHHSTKGDQSGKSVTDVGSGGGAQSRAADCHLVLRPHAEDGLAVLDAAVRTFAPVEPQTIRWNFPLWSLEEGVEAILRADKSRGDSRQETKDREAIGVLVKIIREEKGEPKTAYDLRKKVGYGQDRVNRLIRVGLDDGTFVVTGTKIGRAGDNAELITLPVYADHYFTNSRTSEMNV